ncbi:MAG: FecCD family ABC transporter permease [Sciscionella sp.]
MPVRAVRPSTRRVRHLVLGLLGLLVIVTSSVLLGAIDIGPQRVLGEIVAELTGGTSPLTRFESTILWQLRVPRVALGMLVGAALAGSGAAYQGVFRNPLADPYLLGVAAGAGMAATIVLVVAPGIAGWALPPAAFVGALSGVALTWLLGRSTGGRASSASLLLAGIAVASFLTAVQTFVQQLGTNSLLQVYSWTLGSLGRADWGGVLRVLPYVLGAALLLCLGARLLDVLTLGDEEARALGLRPGWVRLAILGSASLATAAAVSAAGLIGFVGIVVPHVVRLLCGASYRIVVPLSLLGGAAFLLVADMVARTALAPAELPIGVVTAFTGAPFFVLVLRSATQSV